MNQHKSGDARGNENKIVNFTAHETAIIDQGAVIGNGTMIWHFSHIMSSAVIGDDCILGQNVFVGAGVMIGNNVKIQNNVSLYTGVVCEDDTFIGPSVVFTNVINPRSAVSRKEEFKKTTIRKGASIGANATIICGNEIGQYAMIGAGAVITKPVAAYELVAGNPAKQMGWMSEHGEKLIFEERGNAVCPATGQTYFLDKGIVVRIK